MRRFFLFLLIGLLMSQGVWAAQKDAKFRHADLNQDGRIQPAEVPALSARPEFPKWKQARVKVNTPVEAKYDKNGDGWLEPRESKEMLRGKAVVIRTDGKAKVDTPVEKTYDKNDDGVIDAGEASSLMADTR